MHEGYSVSALLLLLLHVCLFLLHFVTFWKRFSVPRVSLHPTNILKKLKRRETSSRKLQIIAYRYVQERESLIRNVRFFPPSSSFSFAVYHF